MGKGDSFFKPVRAESGSSFNQVKGKRYYNPHPVESPQQYYNRQSDFERYQRALTLFEDTDLAELDLDNDGVVETYRFKRGVTGKDTPKGYWDVVVIPDPESPIYTCSCPDFTAGLDGMPLSLYLYLKFTNTWGQPQRQNCKHTWAVRLYRRDYTPEDIPTDPAISPGFPELQNNFGFPGYKQYYT